MSLVRRAGRRALWRHPVQAGLAVLGVAMGVAVVVAVDLANESAREAMRLSVERVAGRATHQLIGGPDGVPESVYRSLRVEHGLRAAAPIVEGGATAGGASGTPLTLLGVDPFAEGPFRDYIEQGDARVPIGTWLTRPGALVLPRETATALGVGAGDTLQLRTPTGEHLTTVLAVIESPERDLGGLVFADVATAQELLGRIGRLDRIDLILGEAAAVRLAASLPEGVSLIPAARRAGALAQMSEAFHVNLTALSLLALVVGLFLVFNTMSFLVLRRRPMIGTLRALGVTRAGILRQVLGDGLTVGIAGTLIGLPLGVLLATGLTDLVLRTVNDLYFATAGGFRLQPASLLKGLLLGVPGTLLATLPAAREATTVPPRSALSRGDLETRSRRVAGLMALAGLGALAAGALVLTLFSDLVAGFAGLFAVIVGTALLVPGVVLVVGGVLGRLPLGRVEWRLAIRGTVASLSRTGVAVAALAVAVSAVIGVGIMIDSFRASVATWLEHTLRADFYVSAPAPMPPATADRLAALDGIDYVTRSRVFRQPSADGFTQVWGLEVPPAGEAGFDLQGGEPARAWRQWRDGNAVFVSEPYAWDHRLAVGDALTLATPTGDRRFEVAGVFRDYGAVQGVVLLRRDLYRALWRDDRLTGIGLHLVAGANRGAVAERAHAVLAGLPGARLRDNRTLFERSLAVFDQTFVITSVLRLLAAAVAFIGVLGALMALQLDRGREYATLRAIGFTRGRLAGLIGGESALLGLAAGVCAVPLGLVLAWLLVFVINRRAFGWTMDFLVAPSAVAEGVALAVVAAALAAVYPAWRAARRLPADGLRIGD